MRRFLFIIIFITGCTSIAIESSINTKCTTRIEGAYFCKSTWNGKSPALIIGSGQDAETIYGKLIDITDDGVIFDPDKQGLYDGPEKKYLFKDIRAAINDKGKVFYGRVSQKYEHEWRLTLDIINLSDSNSKSILVPLMIDQRFSFCLNPGHYRIMKFHFFGNRGSQLESLGPFIDFDVLQDMSNYIGELYINYPINDKLSSYVIPFKIMRKEQLSTGAMFGAVGGALEAIYLESVKDAAGYQIMAIDYDSTLVMNKNLPLNISKFRFQEVK